MYLIDLINVSEDVAFYRDRLMECLSRKAEGVDYGQVFEIVAHFAGNGSEELRRALYQAFERSALAEADVTCAEQIVILCGLKGFSFVMESVGKLAAEERTWRFGLLFAQLEKRHGSRPLPAHLNVFLEEWREHEKAVELARQERPRRELSYEEIRQRILEKGRRAGGISWSIRASAEDIERLAADLCLETDPDRLYGFLQFFRLRAFPGPPHTLMELARHSDEEIARAAMRALKHLSHPAIRSLALETAGNPALRPITIELLTRNRRDEDYSLLEQFLEEPANPDACHALGRALLDFVKADRNVRAGRSLVLLYENGPCALCREHAVRDLIAIDRLPPQLALECREDANQETRGLVGVRTS